MGGMDALIHVRFLWGHGLYFGYPIHKYRPGCWSHQLGLLIKPKLWLEVGCDKVETLFSTRCMKRR